MNTSRLQRGWVTAAAGAGSLSITRTLEGSISGTGFQSAKTNYDTNKTIAITWQ